MNTYNNFNNLNPNCEYNAYCAYCSVKIDKYQDIYMGNDKPFCSNSHRTCWDISNTKKNYGNINTQNKTQHGQNAYASCAIANNSTTPNITSNSMLSYFLHNFLK